MFFDSAFINYATLLSIIGALIYMYIREAFSYWENRKVPEVKTISTFQLVKSIISGKKSVSEVFEDVYNDLKGQKYGGIYQCFTPTLVLKDPEIIKRVMLKDFEYFHERVLYFKENKDPLSANLFTVGGLRWKKMRTKLSPGFTPSKMKLMFHIMLQITDHLVKHIEDLGEIVEIKEVFARYTMDVIASIAFGLETNCLKEPDNEFRKWGKKVFEATPLSGVRNFINFVLPKLASVFYIPFFSKEITEHFNGVVRQTLDYRKEHNIRRNDFMQMLVQLKDKGYIEDDENPSAQQKMDTTETISFEEIVSQAVIFFTAGFETTATSISFCLHEIAVNPDIQTHLYDEISSVLEKHSGKITYDALQQMPYLEMVVCESLRKYPPGAILTRKCCKDFVMPETDNVIIEAGTPVIIPVLGLHRDRQYFPDPDKFDPERFSEEHKSSIPSYVYLPFGEGPRNCIAARFATMEMKVAITALLRKFEFQKCPQTIHPITFDPRAFVLCSIEGMYLRVKNRV